MRQTLGVVLALVLSVTLVAQSSNEQADYAAAASKPQPSDRAKALEQFLAAHPQSSLKLDALELLVWNSRNGGSVADLEHWTSQLMAVSPDNPLAAAIIIGTSLPIANPEPPADRAKRAIGALDHFDRPEGFSHDDFSAMKNFVVATLNGVVGYSYFEQKDFAAARPYLRKAVELLPSNAQFAYTLALSDFQGDKPDQAEGYRMLARSVNLTKGTPAGDSLAQFARQKYFDAGGTNEDWDKYLANTVVPKPVTNAAPEVASAPAATNGSAAPAAPATRSASAAPSPATAARGASASATPSVTSSASVPAGNASTPAATPSSSQPAMSGTAPTTSAATAPKAAGTTPATAGGSTVAMATPAVPPPAPEPKYSTLPPRHIPELTKGAPLSVGLLIQSALAQKGTRQPIVYSLTDMVRRFRQNDEAFVMSFSKGMVFEEDLTSNDKALESAMDSIAPAPGAAIYDAVTFAAGHLNRIARNKNRVLVVISGEGDRSSGVSPLELSSELNVSGVRIYCIGLAMNSPSDQSRLQQLAAYTGGQAFFLSGPEQIRSALQAISNDLGIRFQ